MPTITPTQLDRIEQGVQANTYLLALLLTQGTKIMTDLTDILAAVTENTTVSESIVTLVTQLAAGSDPKTVAAIAGITATIRSNSAKVNAAITANTPAATPPAPAPGA